MRFEKLVQQHRVHSVVANRVNLAICVASHEGWVHLFHVLSHQAKLWDALGIKVFLVMEGHWFEREDGFARLVHRFDRFLETLRGNYRA